MGWDDLSDSAHQVDQPYCLFVSQQSEQRVTLLRKQNTLQQQQGGKRDNEYKTQHLTHSTQWIHQVLFECSWTAGLVSWIAVIKKGVGNRGQCLAEQVTSCLNTAWEYFQHLQVTSSEKNETKKQPIEKSGNNWGFEWMPTLDRKLWNSQCSLQC